jgi:hypothetical protein
MSVSFIVRTERFFEDAVIDGDYETHFENAETFTEDTVEDAVTAIQRLYVSFSEGDGASWARSTDGSEIIDYRTAERETVSVHLSDDNSPADNELIVSGVESNR